MNSVFHAANTRGHADHGWLNSYHTFSFAGYHDPSRVHFGALRVLNDDTVAGGEGFGKHPHDNMEIISIVLEGALEHADTMGHSQALHTGEVQVMSAGSGLYHSEKNHSSTDTVRFLQIWIFPDKRNVAPRYDQQLFDATARVNRWQTLVSPMDRNDEGLKIHQSAWISRTTIEAGQSLEYQLHHPGNGAYVFLIDGAVQAGEQALNRRDGLGIEGTERISFTAAAHSDVLLLEVPMTF